jgi:hypothetical protein
MKKVIVALVISFLVCSFAYGASTVTSVGIDRLRGGQVDVNVPLRVVKDIIELYGTDINDTGHDYWDTADVCFISDVCDGSIPYRSGSGWASGMKEVNAISDDGSGGSIRHYTDSNWTNYALMHGKIVVATGDGNMSPAGPNEISSAGGALAHSVVTQITDVTLSIANDGNTYSNFGATSEVNILLPDATVALLGKVFHFRDVNATWDINVRVDANSTLFDALNGVLLTKGHGASTGAGRGGMDFEYTEPNIINLYYFGSDVNAI